MGYPSVSKIKNERTRQVSEQYGCTTSSKCRQAGSQASGQTGGMYRRDEYYSRAVKPGLSQKTMYSKKRREGEEHRAPKQAGGRAELKRRAWRGVVMANVY